ncbi:hypothetical protein Bbelb_444200 [Branchiostoma belcheri]|nr:hypothetical protein Bbelb_444200 [Branchiostoma belcheri]
MVNTRGSPDPLSPPLWYSRVKVLDKIPDWEKCIYFNPEEALRNKREVYTWVDSKGQPWEDTNPMAPSFSEVLEGECHANATMVKFRNPNILLREIYITTEKNGDWS